jgi:NAD(P)-dependent dehydrogenase (short-subunit alcohol dehydrogenase family)
LRRAGKYEFPTTMSFKGTALVTGAAQGIGRGIALRLAGDGFDVAANDVASKKDSLDSLVHKIMAKGRRALTVIADVSVEAEVKSMVDTAAQHLGGLDVVRCIFFYSVY